MVKKKIRKYVDGLFEDDAPVKDVSHRCCQVSYEKYQHPFDVIYIYIYISSVYLLLCDVGLELHHCLYPGRS